jgi:hypothetical protein
MEVKVWSSGDKFERTKKEDKPLLNSKNEVIHNVPCRGEYTIRKKDRTNEKRKGEIMEREMLVQTYQNPFFNKNYNDVLCDQETYLKPQNSSITKE